MTRLLTNDEIENMINFIQPQKGIPKDTALSITNIQKERLRKQLRTQKVYSEIIPALKDEIEKAYYASLIDPGDSVGVISAQSIGEKQTQTTLNSVDWTEKLLYTKDDKTVVEPIGKMIDRLLTLEPENITKIEENRTEYLPLPEGYMIPSCDENGNTNWYRIEAVTRHLPVGKLVRVVTQSGRTVTATQSKSFLVWDGAKFEGVLGSDVKVGDMLPTTTSLRKPRIEHSYFDMETIFPKNKYLYTTELVKARKQGWLDSNGIHFTVPYNRPDTCFGKDKSYILSCEPGFVSHIPDKIPLDNDFGFLIGIYLAEGWCTKTFVGVSNNDEVIQKRVTDWCDRYGVTYQGTSNDLKIHSTLLAHMFKIICGTGSANKRVPEFSYTAPNEFIKGLIDGYWSGGGTVSKVSGSVIITSVSEDLILGISFLLSYFGIFGRLSSSQAKNNIGIKLTHLLNISNGFAQRFAKDITLTEHNKQEKLRTFTLFKKYRHNRGRSQIEFPVRDVYFDEVLSVEYVDGMTEYVYDLTVEVTRNFQLLNGVTQKDTFHRAGQSEKTMTAGVPRFQELLNATKNPRIVNHKIFFQRGNTSIQEMRETVGSTIVGMTLADISKSIKIEIDKEDEKWYEAHKILFSDEFSMHAHCISFKLDMKKLFEFKLTMQQIADHIHKEYSDLYCVFSPPAECQLDIFVDTKNIRLPEDRLLFVDQDNAIVIYLEEVVQATLEKIYICGIPSISEVFYLKEGTEWIVETNGFCSKTISKQYSSFKKLLAHPHVDYTRTVSNNVWDIYEVLDIEAARQFLIEEFMSIMEGINTCHAMILVDRMTHNGTISSITRYTMKKEESGPMGKASFEETMDNFLNAAAEGDKEPTEGVSASIICGKRASVGTGMIKMSIDISALPKGKIEPCKPFKRTNVIEKSSVIVGSEEDYELPAFDEE
uniref:DNA-directed RNA polymerase n=1 Tax=viral metagenome TaxID=1070528 RepID=A0A6C0H3B1_9ZZZZ